MLDPASWKSHTDHLPPGRSERVDHDCGAGRTLKVTHKEDGFSAYCWRCSDHGWIPHPRMSLSERIAKLAAVRSVELEATASLDLPQPQQHDPQQWPAHARVWLYKAGLSNDDIMQLGFYYCERLERVVMPLYDNGVLVYWQARGFDTKHAKYINPLVSKDKLAAKFGSGPTLVLTEDILSAYRCSKVTQAWSIMGTSISDGLANMIRAQNKPVIIMLDPDPAGIKGNIKARKQLSILGVDCRIVVPNKDPKLLPRKELECLLT